MVINFAILGQPPSNISYFIHIINGYYGQAVSVTWNNRLCFFRQGHRNVVKNYHDLYQIFLRTDL